MVSPGTARFNPVTGRPTLTAVRLHCDAPLVVGFDLDMTLIDTVPGLRGDPARRSAPSSAWSSRSPR